MANIRLLPSGNWNVQLRIKGQASKSRTFKSEAEAAAWAAQEQAASTEKRPYTIYTLGMAYRESRLKGRTSYGQALILSQQLGKAFPQPIEAITAQEINDFKLKRLMVVKASTVRTQLSFMSRFFRFAQRELLLDIPNPLSKIVLPAASKPSDKVVSPEELSLVLRELSPVMALIVELAYESAMRQIQDSKKLRPLA